MKTIITTLLLIFNLASFAQMTWAPNGATWYFRYGEMCIYGGYCKIVVEGDSTVNGQLCKKMHPRVYGYQCNGGYTEFDLQNELTFADDDRVYHWTGFDFETLYDFTLEPGDSYVVGAYEPCEEGDTLLVTETGTMIINGTSLRYYDVELLNNTFGKTIFGRIVERIGPIDSFLFALPRCLTDYGFIGPFRCYHDDAFGEYSSNIVPYCDFLQVDEKQNLNVISIFPNPVENELNIRSKSNIVNLVITDCTGRITFSIKPNTTQIQIHLETFSNGYYLLTTTLENGKISTDKFSKQ